VSGYGERVATSFTAKLNNGIHRTDIYGLLDGRFYQAPNITNPTQVAVKTGFIQTYEARRDLIFSVTGDYTRQQDVFGSWSIAPLATSTQPLGGTSTPPAGGGPPPPPGPTTPVLSASTTVSPLTNPIFYNQFTGSASMLKTFSHASVSLGLSARITKFEQNSGNSSQDSNTYTVPVRVSFYVTPQAYLFSDSSVDWYQYADSLQNTHGYRLTGGIGTDQGIWLVEVYGGYQQEKNDATGAFGGDVVGGRLMYSPTPMWTVQGTFDQSYGTVSVSSGSGTLVGDASHVSTALLYVIYRGLPVGWTTNARAGFVRTASIHSIRIEDAWLLGMSISHVIWRNLSATFDYQFTKTISNITNQSFDAHLVSLGMNYRY
jgi:hypothetical protein